jgi:hypothetical protein
VADASPAPDRAFGRSDRYQDGGRFVMDVQRRFWKLGYVGLGAGHLWTDDFSGWTAGAEISFAF